VHAYFCENGDGDGDGDGDGHGDGEYGTVTATASAKFNAQLLLLNKMEYRLRCGNLEYEGGAQGEAMEAGYFVAKKWRGAPCRTLPCCCCNTCCRYCSFY
jgi:hypothetical protein